MAGQVLGYIGEVIRYIDARKPVMIWFGRNDKEAMRKFRMPPTIATELATSPKFTLPTLGQFYRPTEDLSERYDRKFDFYAEPYEIDMIRYPPYESFVLEFAGRDLEFEVKYRNIDVVFSKYVVLCRQLQDAISIFPFYYLEPKDAEQIKASWPIERAEPYFQTGWHSYGIHFVLKYVPPEQRSPAKRKGLALVWNIAEQVDWEQDMLGGIMSTMWVEVRALLQFLVVLNAKRGLITTTLTDRKKMSLVGRNTGFSYHVLEVDPEYGTVERVNLGGTHASPRFHLRRAHLRHYDDGSVTFVRATTVGSPLTGTVNKDYKIKGPQD